MIVISIFKDALIQILTSFLCEIHFDLLCISILRMYFNQFEGDVDYKDDIILNYQTVAIY